MKVWVVTRGGYSDYRIVGVFSTTEKAEAFKLLIEDANDLEEYEVDGRVEHVKVEVHRVSIRLSDGSVEAGTQWSSEELCSPRFTASGKNQLVGGPELAYGVSAVSPEHALKVAAEFRQNYLREKGGAA